MRWLAAVILCTAGAAQAQEVNCALPSSQVEYNECAAREAQVADDELNRLWKIVKPRADARGQGQALLDAQRAWLKFRDATCDAERASFGNGSMAPQAYWTCIAQLTLRRNDDLRALQ